METSETFVGRRMSIVVASVAPPRLTSTLMAPPYDGAGVCVSLVVFTCLPTSGLSLMVSSRTVTLWISGSPSNAKLLRYARPSDAYAKPPTCSVLARTDTRACCK